MSSQERAYFLIGIVAGAIVAFVLTITIRDHTKEMSSICGSAMNLETLWIEEAGDQPQGPGDLKDFQAQLNSQQQRLASDPKYKAIWDDIELINQECHILH